MTLISTDKTNAKLRPGYLYKPNGFRFRRGTTYRERDAGMQRLFNNLLVIDHVDQSAFEFLALLGIGGTLQALQQFEKTFIFTLGGL